MSQLTSLLCEIRSCEICQKNLPLGPRPVLSASEGARVAIIGQAPGTKVHASGIPWDDQSGKTLRQWMDIEKEGFYDSNKFAIVPMGFCYPGKGKSGDLAPRPECASTWHNPLFKQLPNIKLILLIGQYAQRYYLGEAVKSNLTETVKSFDAYAPKYLPMPHPSPRNRFWLTKNPWFETDVIPYLRAQLKEII